MLLFLEFASLGHTSQRVSLMVRCRDVRFQDPLQAPDARASCWSRHHSAAHYASVRAADPDQPAEQRTGLRHVCVLGDESFVSKVGTTGPHLLPGRGSLHKYMSLILNGFLGEYRSAKFILCAETVLKSHKIAHNDTNTPNFDTLSVIFSRIRYAYLILGLQFPLF